MSSLIKITGLLLFLFLMNTFPYVSNSIAINVNKVNDNIKTAHEWHLESIIINGDWDEINKTYTWCSFKDGFYIIENITIDTPNNAGIIISNSQEPFIIKNCSISNSIGGETYAAVKFAHVKNGFLIDNNISKNNGYGIMTYLSENITINDNIVSNNEESGMIIRRSQNISISTNQVNHNKKMGIYIDATYNLGVSLYQSSKNNRILNNVIDHNHLSGIKLKWCENNTIDGNEIHYNLNYGIRIEYNSRGNSITNNHIIYLQGCIHDEEGGNDINNNYCESNSSIPGYNIFLSIGTITTIGILLILVYEKRKSPFP